VTQVTVFTAFRLGPVYQTRVAAAPSSRIAGQTILRSFGHDLPAVSGDSNNWRSGPTSVEAMMLALLIVVLVVATTIVVLALP
jgi:hypothetical protein